MLPQPGMPDTEVRLPILWQIIWRAVAVTVAVCGCSSATPPPERPSHKTQQATATDPSLAAGTQAAGTQAAGRSAAEPEAASGEAPQDSSPDVAAVPGVAPAPADASESQRPAEPGARPWLGVELEAMPAGQAGVRIKQVFPKSPAAAAGLLSGDVVMQLNGRGVDEPSDVVARVRLSEVGKALSVVFERNGDPRLMKVALGSAPDTEGLMHKAYVGQPAPDFEALKAVQGRVPDRVADARGRVLVIEFWATWCAVCRLMVPDVNELDARFGPQGVSVIGVTMDPVGQASRAARQLGMTYAVASDADGKTTEAYRATSLPTVFVIDQLGIVRDVMVGYSSARMIEIEQLVEALVRQD